MLLKGMILFTAFGTLFFFLILAVEYFLWLNSTGRFILLAVGILVAAILFYTYVAIPIFYLFNLKEGISNKHASLLIGTHFPEVSDKLINLLDLADDQQASELLLASIEQRSRKLDNVPFVKAVNFAENKKYLKYLAAPAFVILIIAVFGNLSAFLGSADRVVNYNLAYEPPAPFSFNVLANDLQALENHEFEIRLTTEGRVKPDDVFIVIGDKEILLQEQSGSYGYTFVPPLRTTDFYFMANGIRSRAYTLTALKIPAIQSFSMSLEYPAYVNKSAETLKGTGNAIIPEGTTVTWKIEGTNTDYISLATKDTAEVFSKNKGQFEFTKRIYGSFPYQLATSNKNVENYETLDYRLTVIKDAYPKISVEQVSDSLNPNVYYYTGEASDDYKLNVIRLVCYPTEDASNSQKLILGEPNSNLDQFYYTYPSGLELEEGVAYSLYFEAIDNDAIHSGKSVKSEVFSHMLLDSNELKNKDLENQESIISNIDKSLEKFKEQESELRDINQKQKEKERLNFNDKRQIKDFLKQQQQQENLMQEFSKQLKENLERGDDDDRLNKLLRERLERQEMEARKNEKLLDELNKIADKIDKEDLSKRLEEVAKKQKNSERGLEQLLELTKRYYVTEKANQLAKDLEKLAERQEQLSKLSLGENRTNKEQEKLNRKYDELAKEMDELKKDNQNLKKPLDLPFEKKKQESIKKDQSDALDEINKHQGTDKPSEDEENVDSANKVKQKQKSAAQKMREMSQQLQESSSGGGSSITEDAEMLRQILDNLVTFSFKQEKLYESLEDLDVDAAQFSGTIKRQQELRGLFEHVDDSLFALSLRQVELAEFVNEQITEVYYNIDKVLESVAENQIYQGASYQKYVLTASNSLADFLAKLLDNMQDSMKSGKGQGQGQDFQLPDIIKSQGELKGKMEGMGQSGKGKPQQGKGEGESEKGKEKGEGSQGEGKQTGESGNKGKGSKGGKGDGNKGENGKNQGEGQPKSNGEGSKSGEGEPSEEELRELYEIYKEQQQIRNDLEKQLQDMINGSDRKLGEKLIRQMEDFENDLLENGITQRSLNKMNTINYQLLKLENAAMKQGKKSERESRSNRKGFANPIITRPPVFDNYRNDIEILNRQALPLQQIFQNKVKNYFRAND